MDRFLIFGSVPVRELVLAEVDSLASEDDLEDARKDVAEEGGEAEEEPSWRAKEPTLSSSADTAHTPSDVQQQTPAATPSMPTAGGRRVGGGTGPLGRRITSGSHMFRLSFQGYGYRTDNKKLRK